MALTYKKMTASLSMSDECRNKMAEITAEYPHTNLGSVLTNDLINNNGKNILSAYSAYDEHRKLKKKMDGKIWYSNNKKALKDRAILKRIEKTHGKSFITDNIGK